MVSQSILSYLHSMDSLAVKVRLQTEITTRGFLCNPNAFCWPDLPTGTQELLWGSISYALWNPVHILFPPTSSNYYLLQLHLNNVAMQCHVIHLQQNQTTKLVPNNAATFSTQSSQIKQWNHQRDRPSLSSQVTPADRSWNKHLSQQAASSSKTYHSSTIIPESNYPVISPLPFPPPHPTKQYRLSHASANTDTPLSKQQQKSPFPLKGKTWTPAHIRMERIHHNKWSELYCLKHSSPPWQSTRAGKPYRP